MINNTSCIALITARSGSKGIPNKNLKIINGQSLLERAIKSATDKRLSSVYVSSDNIEYQKIAESFGVKYHSRNKESANDFASSSKVIESFNQMLDQKEGIHERIIVLLEPTSPFRRSTHVSRALDIYFSQEEERRPLVSVTKLKRKPYNILETKEEYSNILNRIKGLKYYKYSRRQDINSLYRINSAIYIFKNTEDLNDLGDKNGLTFYEMNSLESNNIDTQEDLIAARASPIKT